MTHSYVADASKKIRSVKRANALAGKCAGRPPYGYRAINGSNQAWEIDEDVADNVREVFKRIIAGDGPHVIAKDFDSRGIDTPLVYYRKLKGLPPLNEDTTWFTYIISQMCENRAYIGQLVSQKTTTPSYKNHKKVHRPVEDWVIIENHHAPIVDTETFEIVQKLRANRRRPTKRGDVGVLSGLLFCADCNYKLVIAGSHEGKYQYYVCSRYHNVKKHYRTECSRHGIRRDTVEGIVLSKICDTLKYACENREVFADQIRKVTHRDSEKAIKGKLSELAKTERRIIDLDKIIKRIYEDNIAGKLSDERFARMLADYESEQSELDAKTAVLRAEAEELQGKIANVQSFVNIVDRCAEVTELTADVARLFIDRVVVHEAVLTENPKRKGHNTRSQEVHIFFNCIGEFNPE